jgi:hypothetical protein
MPSPSCDQREVVASKAFAQLTQELENPRQENVANITGDIYLSLLPDRWQKSLVALRGPDRLLSKIKRPDDAPVEHTPRGVFSYADRCQ